MSSHDVCVNCGYQPCRCPWYPEDDKYDIYYDELMEATHGED